MKIIHLVNILFYDNRYWVKYSYLNPQGKAEVMPVSFRTLEEAKDYHRQIKNKINA